MPSAIKGTLIKCDPAIRALVVLMDAGAHDIILEELDDMHLLIVPAKVEYVRQELNARLNKTLFDPEEDS